MSLKESSSEKNTLSLLSRWNQRVSAEIKATAFIGGVVLAGIFFILDYALAPMKQDISTLKSDVAGLREEFNENKISVLVNIERLDNNMSLRKKETAALRRFYNCLSHIKDNDKCIKATNGDADWINSGDIKYLGD